VILNISDIGAVKSRNIMFLALSIVLIKGMHGKDT
jgi:hypothetical protein